MNLRPFYLAVLMASVSMAQDAAKPRSAPVLPHGGVLTIDDFKAILNGTTWTWGRSGVFTNVVNFGPNGVFLNLKANWSAKWVAIDPHTVEIRKPGYKKPAKLTFAADYSSYSGVDLGGQFPIIGELTAPEALPK